MMITANSGVLTPGVKKYLARYGRYRRAAASSPGMAANVALAANATARGSDPTRTTTIRSAYITDIRRRFTKVKGVIRKAIVNRNALGLSKKGRSLQTLTAVNAATPLPTVPDSPEDFKFTTDPNKVAGFMDWLRDSVLAGLLEIDRESGRGEGEAEWTKQYIRAAYGSAITRADRLLAKQGVALPNERLQIVLNKPVHAEKLALLFTRNFEELEGITTALANAIRRELTLGLAQGISPRDMAKRLNDTVNSIGIRRALTLARTEIINAHAEATLTRYEEFRVRGVSAEVEFTTAGDDRVCQKCKAIEEGDNIFTIAEARGVIPVHPNCRCAWLPVV